MPEANNLEAPAVEPCARRGRKVAGLKLGLFSCDSKGLELPFAHEIKAQRR